MKQWKLPNFPYLGLAQYDAEQSPLFAGRADQIDLCAEIVAQSDTRILMLHGQTGCGKSSFLRAGLIPALENAGFGYVFVRRPSIVAAEEGSPVFIRCGKDPLESLARDLYFYLSEPVILRTALGLKPFDLSAAKLGCSNVDEFVNECRDPECVMDVLSLVSATLVHTLVVVLDQMEEVLTLNQPGSDNRTRFFTFLKLFNSGNHHVKLILSLRKDHSGEFLGMAQLDNTARAEFKVYLLPDMTRNEVLSAILLPTLDDKFPDLELPSAKYRFRYAPGIAELIVDELFSSLPRGGVLPVMQIVCRDLYDSVRKGPEPWVITEAFYKKNRIEGSIRQHVINSLREPLYALNLSESRINDEERGARRVLFQLIRYEGDGRVSTDVKSRESLLANARDERVSHFEVMLTHLVKPDILVLRNINVPGANSDDSATLIGLGHDVVGLALHSLKIENDAVERAEKRRRWRRIVFKASFSMLLLSLLGVWWVKHNEQQAQIQFEVDHALSESKKIYSENPDVAEEWATTALGLSSSLDSGSDEKQKAERIVKGLRDALPFATLNLPSNDGLAGIRLHGLLESTPGVISVDSTGEIRIYRIDVAEPRFVLGPALKAPNALQLSQYASLSASEPDHGHILLLITANVQGPTDGDRDFQMFLIREKDGQVKGPYGGTEMMTKFKVIRHRDFPGKNLDRKHPVVSGVSLAGDVVTLTATISGRNFVVSLLADPNASTDYFSPAVDLPMEVPRQDSIAMEVPETSNQLIAGGLLFSAHYLAANLPVQLPKGAMNILKGTPLRGGMQHSDSISNPWEVRIADVRAVAECIKGGFRCNVELLPPSGGRLQVLSLTTYKFGQQDFRPNSSTYIVVDSDSGKYIQFEGRLIESARKTCALFPHTEDPLQGPGASVPMFELGTLDNMVFAYKNMSAIQFVRIQDGQFSCTERLLPYAQNGSGKAGTPSVNQSELNLLWRFLPDQNLVFALDSGMAMAWRLSTPDPTPKSSLSIAKPAIQDAK